MKDTTHYDRVIVRYQGAHQNEYEAVYNDAQVTWDRSWVALAGNKVSDNSSSVRGRVIDDYPKRRIIQISGVITNP